jgi:succinyl-diaminopimelate desuccinylase
MTSLESILKAIDASEDDIIETTLGMIRIPALAPVNGGDGESKKADFLQGCLTGFDEVVRVDVPDASNPAVARSNILARKVGSKPGTVWIVAHMDVVPAGDPSLWNNPPFEPVYEDGRIYGRGTEDNGQSIISSMFASRFFEKGHLGGMSLGVCYVADEETTSEYGIEYLLDHGYFSEDDVIMVPDWGSPNGSMVEVSEKSSIWIKVCVEGKTTHGSTPQEGINAYRVSTRLLCDLLDSFPKEFSDEDDMFMPAGSTFEPTKRPATVENVNTIPGYDEFCIDCRILPQYSVDDVFSMVERIASEHALSSGAKIRVEEIQRHESGKPSSVDSIGYKALSDSVCEVLGASPKAVGVGGGTCANFFRLKGFDAYVWQCGGGTLHAPNEYVEIQNIIKDAKVFATLYYKLCV